VPSETLTWLEGIATKMQGIDDERAKANSETLTWLEGIATFSTVLPLVWFWASETLTWLEGIATFVS